MAARAKPAGILADGPPPPPAATSAAAAADGLARPLAAFDRPALFLQKTLAFSDPALEADYLAAAAERGRPDDTALAVLRALVWAVFAARQASAALRLRLVLYCAAPSLAHVCCLLAPRAPLKRLHATASAVLQTAVDVAGLLAVWHAAQRGEAGWSGLCLLWFHPLQGAAYVALTTLVSITPFALRLACNTVHLLTQLLLCTAAPPREPRGAGPWALGLHRACAPLCVAAFCLPLYAQYWREARRRVSFAAARGLAASTSRLDPLEPLSFVVPALGGAVQVWCWWG